MSKRILLLEDNFELSLELIRALRNEGYDAHRFGSAHDAIHALEQGDFDAVVSDIIIRNDDGRPVPDGGISLIHWIRSRERDRQARPIPIIAISGAYDYRGMSHILTTARSIGADWALQKPFDMAELMFVLREYF